MAIGCWVHLGHDLQGEARIFRKIADGQLVGRGRKAVVGKRLAVDGKAHKLQFVTVENERRTGGRIGAALYGERCAHDGFFRLQCEVEFRFGYGVRCLAIIFETESMAGFSTHCETLSLNSWVLES